ncbi:hypothetical protein [Mucilaginibacter sp.]|uniref:hypothetical protein n=1 Tax=Mucilaginibacter sp. TaxID=1882438 RepID=UPI000CAFBA03|nr:hypothetical protein [Mucilaginibacter sp.]PLW90771.1 MAG: hypothetical protein C0154_04670 [Mucilaginibacter sp.]HEK21994.1 hypothetical protein [Bacteroidota bacterium]
MKPYLKIALPLLAFVVLLNASCKKSDAALNKKPAIDTALMAKSREFVMNFNKSFQKSLTNTPENNSKTSNGVNTVSVFDAQNPCGSSVVKKTNYTNVINGDIYSYVGNSVFTYLCNGAFNNGYNVDAYALKDTLSVYGGGPESPNTEYTAFNYVVKAADTLYQTITISGSQAHKTTNIQIGFGINEKTEEYYKWQNVFAKRTDKNPVIVSGTIDFNISYANYFMGKGDVGDLIGTMEYLPNDLIRVSIYKSGTVNQVYYINRTTGKITQ